MKNCFPLDHEMAASLFGIAVYLPKICHPRKARQELSHLPVPASVWSTILRMHTSRRRFEDRKPLSLFVALLTLFQSILTSSGCSGRAQEA